MLRPLGPLGLLHAATYPFSPLRAVGLFKSPGCFLIEWVYSQSVKLK